LRISEEEIKKEKLILNKVNKLLEHTLDELKTKITNLEVNTKEFQKMVWDNEESFDAIETHNAMMESRSYGFKKYDANEHYRRLMNIKNKPYFASIVFIDEDGTVNNIYIALTYLNDKTDNNILYDWRSPICSLFYDYEVGLCSYKAPGGIYKGELKRKRQYNIKDGKLLGVFDNNLNINDEVLQDVLASDTSGKMTNVVNTIQKEQNQVIRNIVDKTLIVQGSAGSGKTTVALHRIAYLLYQNRELNSNNILIFSPNSIFTDYISDVLPSLGEANTKETTFNDYLSFVLDEYEDVEDYSHFVSRYYSEEEINPTLISYKQSDQIVIDMNNYLLDYIKNARFNDGIIENKLNKVSKEELNEMLTYKYDKFPLFNRVEAIAERLSNNFYKGSSKKIPTFRKLLYSVSNFKQDYKAIYKGFYHSKYAKLILDDKTINSFTNGAIISYEDSLLFCYMKGILEGFRYENNIKQVVIDEAQDYNKLQYIIIHEIFKKSHFTILGDINQNINPYYKYDSLKELSNLFNDSNYIELEKTYRSTPEIINYTNKILNLNHVNAIRNSSNKPVVFRKDVNLLVNDLKHLKELYKSIAIICKNEDSCQKLYNLIHKDIEIDIASNKIFKDNLIIIPAYLAKGLEFEAVIVYNNRSDSYHNNEKNLLYVACTRAEQELYIYN
jgi:DNA helicase-2/ATP-dependent DNA helicase PcrA